MLTAPRLLHRFQHHNVLAAQADAARGEPDTARMQRCIDRLLNFELARRLEPACVHVHFAFNALDWVAAKRALGPRLRLVVSCLGRDLTVDAQKHPGMLVPVFNEADLVLVSSRYLYQLAVEAGCPPDKIALHPVEVDTDFFSPPPHGHTPAKVQNIISVGRLVWEKDYPTALRALATLGDKAPPWHYHIVGDGPLRGELEALAAQLDLTDKVTFWGAATPGQIRDHFWQSHIFLITSVSEGLGAAALEAQACGLPVVATAAGGLPETIEDGRTGLLSTPGNPVPIAAHLLRLLQTPALCQRMGKAAIQHIHENFSAKVLYPQLFAYYGLRPIGTQGPRWPTQGFAHPDAPPPGN